MQQKMFLQDVSPDTPWLARVQGALYRQFVRDIPLEQSPATAKPGSSLDNQDPIADFSVHHGLLLPENSLTM
jgi:hypothetical protein